ncbi:MAG: hypothetical protein GY856_07390 [bacterium]|nr:hypothetical protein [bacterium]
MTAGFPQGDLDQDGAGIEVRLPEAIDVERLGTQQIRGGGIAGAEIAKPPISAQSTPAAASSEAAERKASLSGFIAAGLQRSPEMTRFARQK